MILSHYQWLIHDQEDDKDNHNHNHKKQPQQPQWAFILCSQKFESKALDAENVAPFVPLLPSKLPYARPSVHPPSTRRSRNPSRPPHATTPGARNGGCITGWEGAIQENNQPELVCWFFCMSVCGWLNWVISWGCAKFWWWSIHFQEVQQFLKYIQIPSGNDGMSSQKNHSFLV